MSILKVNQKQPEAGFSGLINDILKDSGFDQWVSPFYGNGSSFKFPPVNITESKEAYQLELAAPGLAKNDFKIKLEDKLLTIAFDHQKEEKREDNKVIRQEFGHTSFKRSFTLDDKIDSEKINAKYDNGVLKLHLPKKEDDIARNKEITVE